MLLGNNVRLRGVVDTEIKEKGNKYYLAMYMAVDSDHKKKSLVYVEMKPKTYNKIKDEYLGSRVVISGQGQIKKTKKDIPYLHITCKTFDILKHNNENSEKTVENKKEKNISWHENLTQEDFVLIETSKIKLVEEQHLKGIVYFDEKNYDPEKPIAVRKLEDGTYSLLTGFWEYTYVKLLNKELVKAYVCDLTLEEFKEKHFLNQN